MPQSGAVAETWQVGTQTLGWRAAGVPGVLSGHVLGAVVEPAALVPSNPSDDKSN